MKDNLHGTQRVVEYKRHSAYTHCAKEHLIIRRPHRATVKCPKASYDHIETRELNGKRTMGLGFMQGRPHVTTWTTRQGPCTCKQSECQGLATLLFMFKSPLERSQGCDASRRSHCDPLDVCFTVKVLDTHEACNLDILLLCRARGVWQR